jgi:hypothetical protein
MSKDSVGRYQLIEVIGKGGMLGIKITTTSFCSLF